MNVSRNNNDAATNPAKDAEMLDVPVAAVIAGRSSRSSSSGGWASVKKVLPEVVVRKSFTGKMAISGSRQKEKFAKRGSDVPPADPENLEKNFDSVSTLGAPSIFQYSSGSWASWKAKRTPAADNEDGEASVLRQEKKANARRECLRAYKSSRRPMTIADLANSRRKAGRQEKDETTEPQVEKSRRISTKMLGRKGTIHRVSEEIKESSSSSHDSSSEMSITIGDLANNHRKAGRQEIHETTEPKIDKSRDPLQKSRHIREGLEASSSSSDEGNDTISALKSVIANLKQKLRRETERVVRLEVELEVANETIRKLSKEGEKRDRASSWGESSTAAYDLYVLKSKIKDLEVKNKALKKQLIEHLSAA